MFEGSKNERVAIVITSYIIGFATAFIAFGGAYSHGVHKFKNSAEELSFTQSASVIQSMAENEAEESYSTSLEKRSAGLYFVSEKGERLLSQKGVSGEEGSHVQLFGTSLADNEAYVYFCEQPTSETDVCAPYVYSAVTDVVYPVTIEGERVAFQAEAHDVVWSGNGPLSIAGVIVDQLPE